MKNATIIFILLLFLAPVIAFSQSPVNIKAKFVGKWLLVKHTLTENKKTEDLLTSNEIYTYNFAADNTYEVSYINKKNESTTVYKGKWKMVSGGKKINLYDNHIVPDPAVLVGNRMLPIIRVTTTEFVTKELLFGMDLLGTSYYKKL